MNFFNKFYKLWVKALCVLALLLLTGVGEGVTADQNRSSPALTYITLTANSGISAVIIEVKSQTMIISTVSTSAFLNYLEKKVLYL